MPSANFSPCAILLETGKTDQDLQSPVLHIFPNTAVHSGQAQMLCPLFIALAGVTSKLTGQQVRLVTFAEPSPGFKAAYVPCQGSTSLVFCWPLSFPDATAIRLAQFVVDILFSILGSIAGWLKPAATNESQDGIVPGQQASQVAQSAHNGTPQPHHLTQSCLLPWAQQQLDWLMGSVFHQLSLQGWQPLTPHLLLPDGELPTHTPQKQALHEIELVLKQLEMDAAALEPLALVGQPQACLFFRGRTIASHMPPNTARLVWACCWTLSFFQRTAAHPPVVMLQDLQVSSHAGSKHNEGSFETPGSMAGTVCMRLIMVAAGQSVLCMGCWPRAAARLEATAGDARSQSKLLLRGTRRMHKTVTLPSRFAAQEAQAVVCKPVRSCLRMNISAASVCQLQPLLMLIVRNLQVYSSSRLSRRRVSRPQPAV